MKDRARPPTVEEAFAAGVGLHQQGQLAQAETIYRGVLRAAPRHAGALHLLGLAHFQRGDPATAARLIGQSVELDPRNAVSRNNHGAVLLALGRPGEALAAFDEAAALKPDYAEALNNAGNALIELGRAPEALDRYEKALQLGLRSATLFCNRGIALHELGRGQEALESFDQAIAMAPGHADAHANRGEALRRLKRHGEAIASLEQAIALGPGRAQPLNNLGTTLFEMDRLEEAVAAYDRAIAADPAHADAHSNRANALARLNRYEQALAGCDRALACEPGHREALRNRITPLLQLGRFAEALDACDKALALDAGRGETHFGRGMALLELRRFDEALDSIERAMALVPGLPYAPGLRLHLRMHLCEWAGFEADCAKVIGAVLAGEKCSLPFAVLALPASASAQLECARTLVRDKYPAHPGAAKATPVYSHDRIRVGYFSADFHDHATAHLIAGLLERHDRSRFEIVAFSFGPGFDDPWRRRLQAGVDRFLDVATWPDERIASVAREMEIDIAVDLKGFTSGARTGIFAMRAAPVQVSYLGYPGTLGADYIDYLIADPTVVPGEHEPFYTETLARLPHCYQANDSSRKIADRAFSRGELGLPDDAFVFCCFNNSYKITPAVFDAWMRLLGQVPGSVLWLLGTATTAQGNLRRHAVERGIAADRLVFAAVMEPDDHLARHRAADLFLDTFHYNAHTTASDALWAGLPVVTLEGETFASRVASSLLRAVGLPELVARTREDYEALALELATAPEKLASLRVKLAANRETHPLFDTALFTRHLESALSAMHERHLRGLPPERIDVPA